MAAFSWFQDGTYTRKQLRQLIGAALGGKTAARPLGAGSGVTSPSPALTVTSTTWTVGSFTAILDLETDGTMGPSLVVNDGTQTGSVNAASSSYERYDLLSLTLLDPTTPPTIVYTAGTSATTLPATPANSIPFAQITVPATGGGSPTITLIAPSAVAAGGILVVSGTAAWPGSPNIGQYIDDPMNGLLRWNGTTWAPPAPLDIQFKVTTGGQSLPAIATTPVNTGWASEAWCSTAAGIAVPSGTYTIQTAGDYDLSGAAGVALTGSSRFDCDILANSTVVNSASTTIATTGPVTCAPRRVTLAAGVVVSMEVFAGSGATSATVVSGTTWLRIKRVA